MVQEPRIIRSREEERNLIAMFDLDMRMHNEERIEP